MFCEKRTTRLRNAVAEKTQSHRQKARDAENGTLKQRERKPAHPQATLQPYSKKLVCQFRSYKRISGKYSPTPANLHALRTDRIRAPVCRSQKKSQTINRSH